jgi:antitoxin (DNA-binding transcriptional repressor) of toxin-antitoxin stability system
MTQDTPPPTYFDLEMLAAQLRKHTDDLSLYSGFLLNVLSAALPGEIVTVRREGKIKARLGGRSEPAVLSVSVHLGNHRFELDRGEFGRPLTASIRHESGGVVMSSRVVTLDEWSREMAAQLNAVAASNAAAAEILARLTTL